MFMAMALISALSAKELDRLRVAVLTGDSLSEMFMGVVGLLW